MVIALKNHDEVCQLPSDEVEGSKQSEKWKMQEK
jgi:hypothetical protein